MLSYIFHWRIFYPSVEVKVRSLLKPNEGSFGQYGALSFNHLHKEEARVSLALFILSSGVRISIYC